VHDYECHTAERPERESHASRQQQLEELADIFAEVFLGLTPEQAAVYLSGLPKAA